MRIVISEFMDAAAVALLAAHHETLYDADLADRRAELKRQLSDADALVVRNRTLVNAELLAAATRLRVVGRLGVGLDNIDVPACEARGIVVIPATGANALAVAEYVIGTSMMLLRGAYASTHDVAAGKWPRVPLSNGRELAGRTLGIVGFGGIGRLVAGLARCLSMRVIGFDAKIPAADPVWGEEKVEPRTLDALLAAADVLTLHVPLVPATRNLIDAARIGAMKQGAILVNTARGGVVDEAAVAAALRSGHLGGAALDVFEKEPFPPGSPLEGAPNLILTPHVAGLTVEANERVSSMIAQRVITALASRT
jgi:(S)-sulfolactate dehydrogenase